MSTSQGTLKSSADQKKLSLILICLALAILTVITFWSLKDCGFVNFDDNFYVYDNVYVQSGLNWNNIGQAFSYELVEKSGNWHPLTWLSYMLDYSIFGLNPFGYHLMNLLFHVLNTLLLFLVLRRMTKKLWPSAFVACLFAIHPLHVESVAWIAERKDVLSTFFWMLTMGAYSYYVENRRFRRYFFVLLFFVLGLMAKPMLVTLPFVLLLLDYWPLQRFSEIKLDSKVQTEVLKPIPSGKSNKKSKQKQTVAVKEIPQAKKPVAPEYSWSRIYPLLWEKVPLFVLAILSSVLTYIAQQNIGFMKSIEIFPINVRIGNAFVSYITYIGKMIWPSNLAVLYPYPQKFIPWQVLGSVSLLIVITLVVIWRVKKSPYLATGWLWYIGALVPVIGIVQVGNQAMSDRYTYIPLIGLFIIVAWGVPELLKKWKHRKAMLLALSALIILCLSIKTWTQVGYWENSITLWNHTLKVTDDNGIAYNMRGLAYAYLGNYKQAIEDYNRAIEIYPIYPNAYSNRSAAYLLLGNYKQSVEDYNKSTQLDAIASYDRRAIEDFNKAAALNYNDPQKAIEYLNNAIKLQPNYANSYHLRGNNYATLKQYHLALEDYNEAIRLNPTYPDTYQSRGVLHTSLLQYQRAIEDFSNAISLKHDNVEAYKCRGYVYFSEGNKKLGCADAKKACALGNCQLSEVAKNKGYCR